jgi:hypothetical protein
MLEQLVNASLVEERSLMLRITANSVLALGRNHMLVCSLMNHEGGAAGVVGY